MSTQAVRSTTASGSAVYESSRAVDEYLQFHFAKCVFQLSLPHIVAVFT
jgi:hypothetical protein